MHTIKTKLKATYFTNDLSSTRNFSNLYHEVQRLVEKRESLKWKFYQIYIKLWPIWVHIFASIYISLCVILRAILCEIQFEEAEERRKTFKNNK